tara:strand:+ start:13190 stop:14191 length:1002 start_codon:yes stop_codon:yes gene_type:complete
MGNTSTRQYTYQEYHRSIENNNENIRNKKNSEDFLKNINLKNLNHYEVLNVNKNFTWNELKDSYRKLAINTHPDKPGGNKELFNIITYSFKILAKDYKDRDSDLEHYDLKKQSGDFFEKITKETMHHPSDIMANTDEIFATKFNRNFEKCKVYDDDMDFGYGAKMQESSKVRDDINIEKLIKKDKIDNDSFNKLFNKNVPVNKQLVKYKEPEPLLLSKSLNFTELGGKKPDDYSSSMEKSNNLSYTDYMRAHDGTRLIDPSLIKSNKQFKTVEEYKAYRDNKAEKKMSENELKIQKLKKIKEEKEEDMRLNRLKNYDQRVEKSFNKANKLFLK